MSLDSEIDQVIEEILERDCTPEEACAERPEIMDEVRARLRKIRAVEAQLNSIFPPSEHGAKTLQYTGTPLSALPTIPEYEIQSILGRGGMGIIYKAQHLKLNRTVALKMLLTGSYASQKELARFVREAESVAALRHPNIVQVYDIGEVNGHAFYTMEYVRGGSLAEKLGGNQQPARDSAKILCELARAVQEAHASGIVHRDLKPANVLLTEAGVAKIADFGLARWLDRDSSLTHTGARIGTPNYMAPEQMLGSANSLGPAVDIFALGAMLYEMLTGRTPFKGSSLSDTERRLALAEPARPSKYNAKVPRDLETICLKCLEKDPHARYATAGDLAADLERFLHHEPIHARPVSPAERSLRWICRNPLPAALAAAFVVVIGLLANQLIQEWSLTAARRAEKNRLTARLESGIQLVQTARFAEAHALLEKLGDGGFEDLRQRIDRVLIDLELAEKLDAIGVKRAMALNASDSTWNPNAKASSEYQANLARAGFGSLTDDPAIVGKRIKDSDIEAPLIAAYDDWAGCETDPNKRNWIIEVARHADPTQSSWQKQFRDPAAWNDRAHLARLAETAAAAKPSIQQLRVLGDRLADTGSDATPFRNQVQREHVDSFLANLALGNALRVNDPTEAIRYFQAALAIRPNSATAHNNLAVALASLGRSTEAIPQYEQALVFDPNSAIIEYNLGLELSKIEPKEASPHLQKSIELNSKLAVAQRTLAVLYFKQQRYPEAVAALRRCLALLKEDDGEYKETAELIRQYEQQTSKENH
jgi:serine/threonine protein kinase/Tfp pilus assembly protein PilF